ncbi:hypothetical protein Dsin_013439 [Dipteronia sinensis]|uniref:SWIM-type domain-containing protein n=1 Tax=Dipteronia sinensis TaxID=43782 RepID=A0AAE0AL80_9ROSI|nr:hypothetical protein Dsin_013439 [Dipteronia sinensis]
MTTLPQTFRPSMPIEIVDDEDVALLLRRENVDPLVCISVEEIGHESPEMKHKPPEFSHNLHYATLRHESHHTMDEFQRSDVPKVACLDDIREGFTPIANIDTYPPRHFSFQVAPRPVTIRLEVGELFPSKKHLQSQVGSYALANRFQIRVFKSDKTRYQVRCIVEDCNWRLRAAKVHNSDYFQIRKLDNQHTCSTEARFPHQRQASARVIGEHIHEKFHDHLLYKPNEIIHDMQREFGISCNYHKGYRARHIALEEVQGIPVESYTRVYRESQFLQRMEQLSNINPEAAQYVTDARIERWARAYSPRKRYNIMSTNIAEAMNNAVKECKELPITGVIDYIRGVLQCWFHDRRTAALKLTTQLTTAADVAIGVKDDEARYTRIYPITFYTFHVKDGGLDGIVDLTTKTCSCKEFDVDQLPCAHALGCIRLRGFSFVDYCSPYYSSAFLVAAYSGEIHPLGHPSEWLVPEDIASKIVHPPVGLVVLEDLKRITLHHLERK